MPASSILTFSSWSEIMGEKTNVNMWPAKTECHIVILQEESSLFVVHLKEFHNVMHDTKSNLFPAFFSVSTRAGKSKSLIRWKRLKGGKRRKKAEKANLIYN